MSTAAPVPGGILIACAAAAADANQQALLQYVQGLGLADAVTLSCIRRGETAALSMTLAPAFQARHAPGHDTTGIAASLGLRPEHDSGDLEREILLAILASPVAFPLPEAAELASAGRIRRHIVQAARRTALAFDTEQAERPQDDWVYDEQRGFTVLPGRPLVEALRKATQPDESGRLYSFSCYRATEYVTVLGIAQELQACNPELAARLQRQWETRAVMSGLFHDTFLREYGSLQDPLPPRYYVPGDRLWFRNPDEHSSNVEGYEGSWVFYLGSGLFNNFWKRDQPYTLAGKCVEIYHWRHGARRNEAGKLIIDESIVEARVHATMADPQATARVLERMVRIRDPQGIYAEGGCIDATRECARWVGPGHTDIVLPDFPRPA